ncbi:N42L2 protein, partial [Polypterus senegalus]
MPTFENSTEHSENDDGNVNEQFSKKTNLEPEIIEHSDVEHSCDPEDYRSGNLSALTHGSGKNESETSSVDSVAKENADVSFIEDDSFKYKPEINDSDCHPNSLPVKDAESVFCMKNDNSGTTLIERQGPFEFKTANSKCSDEWTVNSSSFIGPKCKSEYGGRPNEMENELSQFYRELEQIDPSDPGAVNLKSNSSQVSALKRARPNGRNNAQNTSNSKGRPEGRPHFHNNGRNNSDFGAPKSKHNRRNRRQHWRGQRFNDQTDFPNWNHSDASYDHQWQTPQAFLMTQDQAYARYNIQMHQRPFNTAQMAQGNFFSSGGGPYMGNYEDYYNNANYCWDPSQGQIDPNYASQGIMQDCVYGPYPTGYENQLCRNDNSFYPYSNGTWVQPFDPQAANGLQGSQTQVEAAYTGAPQPQTLILMRGMPGSGKSTHAQELAQSNPNGVVLSTDDYFSQQTGYSYDPSLLGDAHEWNQSRAKEAMEKGQSPIVIDNTNTQAWEMKPYVQLALEKGYNVEFHEPNTGWKFDPVELEKNDIKKSRYRLGRGRKRRKRKRHHRPRSGRGKELGKKMERSQSHSESETEYNEESRFFCIGNENSSSHMCEKENSENILENNNHPDLLYYEQPQQAEPAYLNSESASESKLLDAECENCKDDVLSETPDQNARIEDCASGGVDGNNFEWDKKSDGAHHSKTSVDDIPVKGSGYSLPRHKTLEALDSSAKTKEFREKLEIWIGQQRETVHLMEISSKTVHRTEFSDHVKQDEFNEESESNTVLIDGCLLQEFSCEGAQHHSIEPETKIKMNHNGNITPCTSQIEGVTSEIVTGHDDSDDSLLQLPDNIQGTLPHILHNEDVDKMASVSPTAYHEHENSQNEIPKKLKRLCCLAPKFQLSREEKAVPPAEQEKEDVYPDDDMQIDEESQDADSDQLKDTCTHSDLAQENEQSEACISEIDQPPKLDDLEHGIPWCSPTSETNFLPPKADLSDPSHLEVVSSVPLQDWNHTLNVQDRDDVRETVSSNQPDILSSVIDPFGKGIGISESSDKQNNSEMLHVNSCSGQTLNQENDEEVVKPQAEFPFLHLQLPLKLALQLAEFFGSRHMDIDSLTPDDLTIPMDLELSKMIHSQWMSSIEKRYKHSIVTSELVPSGANLHFIVDFEGCRADTMSLEELMGNLSLRANNRHRGRRRRDRPKLFILRGLPGSGKSTLARQIRNEFGSAEIFSTDDFFRDEFGRYHFNARELREAHEWNKKRAREAMEEGLNPIIIDNTNIHAWEMKPYVRMGLDNGYYIIFKEPETGWKNDIHKLHRGFSAVGLMEGCGIQFHSSTNIAFEMNVLTSILGHIPQKHKENIENSTEAMLRPRSVPRALATKAPVIYQTAC